MYLVLTSLHEVFIEADNPIFFSENVYSKLFSLA